MRAAGCRVRHCAGSTIRHRDATRTMALPGSHGERLEVSSSGYEAGRRSPNQHGRCPPLHHRTTTLIGRRWVAKGGPEGRSRQNPETVSGTASASASVCVSVTVTVTEYASGTVTEALTGASAWSEPPNQTTSDHADSAAQKAGDEGGICRGLLLIGIVLSIRIDKSWNTVIIFGSSCPAAVGRRSLYATQNRFWNSHDGVRR